MELTGQWIRRPACPEGFDSLPHETVALQQGISCGEEHWTRTHFPEGESSLKQSQRNHPVVVSQSDGSVLEQVCVGCQLLTPSAEAETSPEGEEHVRWIRALHTAKPLRLITPALGSGEQGHLPIAGGGGTASQAAQGLHRSAHG